MRISIMFLICSLSSALFSQSILESKGNDIPEKFRKNNVNAIEKLIQEDELIKGNDSKRQFYISNSYFLDNLYNSGIVVFGHELNQYMNEIVFELLKDDPETRKSVDVFIVKSPVPNAFTTLDGSIFINVGLISRLTSKDELAFVLAHEIGHFLKKHGVEKHIKSSEINRKKKRSDKRSELDATLEHCLFSQEKEMEADMIGLTLFEKSKYSSKALSPLFMTLKHSNLSVFECNLSPEFLETDIADIDEDVLLDGLEIRLKSSIPEEDSRYATHPAPDERLKLLLDESIGNQSELKQDPEFEKYVALCFRESISLYNEEYDFFSALYLAKYYTEQFQKTPSVEFEIVRSMYGISKFRSNNKREYLKPSINHRYSKFFYNTYDFLRKETNSIDMAALAIAKAQNYIEYNTYKKEEAEAILIDLWEDYNDLKISMSHSHVIFTGVDNKLQKSNEQVVFHEMNLDQLFKSPTVEYSNIAIVNPVYSPYLQEESESKDYLLEITGERENYIKHIESTWKTGKCVLLDCKTVASNSAQTFNDASLLEKFYEERYITKIIPNYVSRYSYEVSEFQKRTGITYVCFLGTKPIYNAKEKSYYYGLILDLSSGFIVYNQFDYSRSEVSLKGACGHFDDLYKEISK